MKTSQFEGTLSLMCTTVIHILKSYTPHAPAQTGDPQIDAREQLCHQVRRAEVHQVVITNLESLAKDLATTKAQKAILKELFDKYRV